MCRCKDDGKRHKGMYVEDYMIEDKVRSLLARIILDTGAGRRIDVSTLPESRAALKKDYDQALRDLRTEEEVADTMMRHASLQIRLYGEALYEQKAAENAQALEKARDRTLAIRTALSQPSEREGRTALQEIRTAGIDAVWKEATTAEMRRIVRLFILRIDLLPPPKVAATRGARVTLAEWLRPECGAPELTFPFMRRGRTADEYYIVYPCDCGCGANARILRSKDRPGQRHYASKACQFRR